MKKLKKLIAVLSICICTVLIGLVLGENLISISDAAYKKPVDAYKYKIHTDDYGNEYFYPYTEIPDAEIDNYIPKDVENMVKGISDLGKKKEYTWPAARLSYISLVSSTTYAESSVSTAGGVKLSIIEKLEKDYLSGATNTAQLIPVEVEGKRGYIFKQSYGIGDGEARYISIGLEFCALKNPTVEPTGYTQGNANAAQLYKNQSYADGQRDSFYLNIDLSDYFVESQTMTQAKNNYNKYSSTSEIDKARYLKGKTTLIKNQEGYAATYSSSGMSGLSNILYYKSPTSGHVNAVSATRGLFDKYGIVAYESNNWATQPFKWSIVDDKNRIDYTYMFISEETIINAMRTQNPEMHRMYEIANSAGTPYWVFVNRVFTYTTYNINSNKYNYVGMAVNNNATSGKRYNVYPSVNSVGGRANYEAVASAIASEFRGSAAGYKSTFASGMDMT